MRKILTILALALAVGLWGQPFSVVFESGVETDIDTSDPTFEDDIEDGVPDQKVIKFTLKANANVTVQTDVVMAGNVIGSIVVGSATGVINAPVATDDLRGLALEIKEGVTGVGKFKLVAPEPEPEPEPEPKPDPCAPPPISSFLALIEPYLTATQYGLTLRRGTGLADYVGNNCVHVFFDHRGNSLFSTIPQGISNMKYVVHIVYLADAKDPGGTSYSVRQTQGEFSDALSILNGDLPIPTRFSNQSEGGGCPHRWEWKITSFVLRTSTNNIEFQIYRNADGLDKNGRFTSKSTHLSTNTIPMSKVYHASIDIGFINSRLSDPTFTLVSSAQGDTTVVKRGESGDRGFVTLMATFYTSPVMLLKRKGTIPDFKRTGRNFLDDHEWYERIFPCVGVGISDEAFENLFLGLNWEFARGGSLWFGYHYGRVNVYHEPDEDFEFGETPTSQNEFDLRTDTQWVWSDLDKPSFGVNLDIRLVTRLFSGGQTSSDE